MTKEVPENNSPIEQGNTNPAEVKVEQSDTEKERGRLERWVSREFGPFGNFSMDQLEKVLEIMQDAKEVRKNITNPTGNRYKFFITDEENKKADTGVEEFLIDTAKDFSDKQREFIKNMILYPWAGNNVGYFRDLITMREMIEKGDVENAKSFQDKIIRANQGI